MAEEPEAHLTGDLCVTTGVYRTECECRVDVRIARAEEFPRCQKCRKPVKWQFFRAEPPPPKPSKPESKR